MVNAKAVQQKIVAKDGRGCLESTAIACSKKRRPGERQSGTAITKVVTWLLLPTKRSTTTSIGRMCQSGWEGQIKREKEHGDGRTAAPGGSISGGLSLFLGLVHNLIMVQYCLQCQKTAFSSDISHVLGGMTISGMMLSAVTKNGLSAPKRSVLLLQKPQVCICCSD